MKSTSDDAMLEKARISYLIGNWIPDDGYIIEAPYWMPNCVVIEKIGCLGWVTVDMKRRIFCPGRAQPKLQSVRYSDKRFVGKGWRKRIIEEAQKYLIYAISVKPHMEVE